MLFLMACGRDSNPTVTPADQKVALTAATVAPFTLTGAVVDPTKETWTLEHAADGGWSLEYEYTDDKLVLDYSAVVAPSAGDASWVYMGYGLGKSFVDGTDGVVLVDTPGLLVWGDEAECGMIRTSATDVGFVCRGRDKNRAFMVTVAGISPTGVAAPGPLLAGPLAALEAWDPTNVPR